MVHVLGHGRLPLFGTDKNRELSQVAIIGSQGMGRQIALRFQVQAESADLFHQGLHCRSVEGGQSALHPPALLVVHVPVDPVLLVGEGLDAVGGERVVVELHHHIAAFFVR